MPTATLAGVPLEAVETVGWKFIDGVQAYQRSFEMKRTNAQKLLDANADEVELYYERNGKPKTIKALKILSAASSATHPDRMVIVVADRRWKWDFELIVRYFNIRSNSGEFRLVDGKLLRVPPIADITFKKYSLKGELTEWTAQQAFEDVLNEVTHGQYSVAGVNWNTSINIDGLVLRDRGSTAVQRCFMFIPALTVWVDENGITQAKLESDGGEDAEVKGATPPLEGFPLPEYVKLDRVRPSAIEVYFQTQDEVRFDGLEGYTSSTTSGGLVSPPEPRSIENVVQLPDTIAYVSGPRAGQRVLMNTIVPLDQFLLDAWNADATNPLVIISEKGTFNVPPVTFAIIQRLFLAPSGYHAYYEVGKQSKVWAKRWNAIVSNYRQTYRINRRWVDRCHSFVLRRLAIVDPERGTKAPVDVYADHCQFPTVKRMFAFHSASDTKKMAYNLFAWPVTDTTRLLVDGSLCEVAIVTPVDHDQFVFKIAFKPNAAQIGDIALAFPSSLASKDTGEAFDIPSSDPKVGLGLFMAHRARLSAKHRVSVVLTMWAASQGLSSLYKIEIRPDEAKSVLPSAVANKIGDCRGPVLKIFVPAAVTTARSAWKDEDATLIEGAILSNLARLESRILDPDHLRNVARAIAATYWSAFTDRWEGSLTTAYDPTARPVGRIRAVSHMLNAKGVFVTERDMQPGEVAIDWMALVPEDTRLKLFERVTA